jgi:ABC-type Fe3+-hydroxamate transport system substrate-binding protein
MGKEHVFDTAPKRIISLVPSITELLHDLNLKEEIVGVTKFCIHPLDWCKSKTRIGGTKKINLEKVAELKPDLIIGNKEENTKDDIEALQQEYPVFMTDVNTFDEALEMIIQLGSICNRPNLAHQLVEELKRLSTTSDSSEKMSAIYLIWKDPYFAVGQQTFIHAMMELSGFENIIKKDRYPEITLEEIDQLSPQLLLLSTEPYPFVEKHLTEIKTQLKTTTPVIVDGEMFSWYGSRLKQSFEYFERLKLELEEK